MSLFLSFSFLISLFLPKPQLELVKPRHPSGASVVIRVDKSKTHLRSLSHKLYFMSEMWHSACGTRWSEEEKLKEKKKRNRLKKRKLFGHFGEEKFYGKFMMWTPVLETRTSVLWYLNFINLSNTLQRTRVLQTQVLHM